MEKERRCWICNRTEGQIEKAQKTRLGYTDDELEDEFWYRRAEGIYVCPICEDLINQVIE